MATRDSYAGDPTAGDVLTAANFKKLPGGWIGYDETTSNQATSSTTELTLHTLSVAVDAARKLRISHHARRGVLSVANDEFRIALYYDGTIVNQSSVQTAATGDIQRIDTAAIIDTTTSGSKTIKVTATRIGGTGTLTFNNGANGAAWMLVEDIGASS